MLTKRAVLAGMAVAGFGLVATRPASAQTYPTRPVKMIVPLPPGSAPDVRHRLIAQALTQLWAQQVVVENRPGGGGLIGTRAALGEQPGTHLSLHKDPPVPRAVHTLGLPLAMPVLGGLHHQYFRA